MRSTESLWRALEAMPVLSGVRETWRAAAGSDFAAIERLLRPTARLAGSYPCPHAADEGCARGVVVHGEDEIVAVCGRSSSACDRLTLRRADVVVHRLDLILLARSVGAALGLTVEQPAVVEGLPRTVHVGSFRPAPAVSVPLYLTISPDRAAFADVAERLASRTGGRLLLLAATVGADPDLAESLRARGGGVLALADLLAADDQGGLVASVVAERALREAFSGAVPAAATPETCVFQKQGKTWHLVFEGVTRGVRHSNGMDYLAELLRNPHREIHSARMRDLLAGERPRALGSAGEILDTAALRAIKERLDANKAEQEEAAELQDVARQEKLQEEFDALRGQVARATGLGGRKRQASSDLERARQAVSRAVHRAIKAITREHEVLGRHLDVAVKIGDVLVYAPDRPLIWSL